MTALYGGPELPPELPELHLELQPVPAAAWGSIVRRARRRRDRFVAAVVTATALVVAVPSLVLAHGHGVAVAPAHRPSGLYDGVCDTRYDKPAPATATLDHPVDLGSIILSPPSGNTPAVPAGEIRRRAAARGMRFDPGSQLRYSLVRYTRGGKVAKTELRWTVTTCGKPSPRFAPTRPGAGEQSPVRTGTILQDSVLFLTDSGAVDTQTGTAAFGGVCDTRLDQPAPPTDRVQDGFYLGEALVTPPAAHDHLSGRERVRRALHNVFPGTQIRMGRVQPLHTPGAAQLRWLVTTCSLAGDSVRPALPGVVNELLVYDRSGQLLQTQQAGPQAVAERKIAGFPPVPNPAPTYASAGPDMCGPWSHAYPDFRKNALAAGYTQMQGCYLQAGTVVIFLSSANRPGAAAVYRAPDRAGYQRTYTKRFPWTSFKLIPAPAGSTIRLVRLLSPHVAEVELTGGTATTALRQKFDAQTLRFLPCDDVTATRASCG